MDVWTDICEGGAEGVRAEAARRDLEQSPYGVDALEEIALHPFLAAGIEAAGRRTLREQRLPTGRAHPKRSEGFRCDLVVLPEGHDALADPLLAGTLFGERGAAPDEAIWLEVKAIHQHALVNGVASPNPRYAPLWLREAAADVRKLSAESDLFRRGLLLVVFAADEATIEHDLHAWAHRCLDEGLAIGRLVRRVFPITERIGNHVGAVVAVEVR
ncbi:MAG: hypothetical protein IBJ10_04340 [Phycisphaerales bacterium]|nr:hypothetical protein [Phycisphaerales bacterium]